MNKLFGGYDVLSEARDAFESLPNHSHKIESTQESPQKTQKKYPTSILIDKQLYYKIKYIAMCNGQSISRLLSDACSEIVKTFEEKHGPISF